jgi:hypothetical protein
MESLPQALERHCVRRMMQSFFAYRVFIAKEIAKTEEEERG